jgi:hypothetical protein
VTRAPSRLLLLAVAAAAIAAAAGPRGALAQDRPTLSGTWSASGVAERWSIGEWGDACGPRPASQGAPGGTVQITERGSELSIVGAGRAWSTGECWEQMPGLSRTSHSASGGGRFWRTRCSSAPNDPRQAAVTTTVQATDSSISMTETGQYQFVIQETNCTASVTRSRSYALVRREGEAPPASSAAAPASASAAAAVPPSATAAPRSAPSEPRSGARCTGAAGEPARLEVRPSRKLMRPGDRFEFRTVVLDAEGCGVSARPSWSIAPGPLASKATVNAAGTVAIADDAPEGRLEAVASIGEKGVTIPIEIASAEHYDALLATSGLDDAGEADAPAVAIIATGTIGGRAGVADDVARARKQTFVAIVGGLAVLLGLAGLALHRRGSAARRGALAARAGSEAPADGEATGGDDVAAEMTAPPVAAATAPSQAPAATRPRTAGPRGKICPTCGQHFPAEASFCGKDGTTLVPLN